MKRAIRAAGTAAVTTTALVSAAVTTGTTPTSATAHSAAAASTDPAHAPGFGYTEIREGVPGSAARFTVTSPDVTDGGVFPADAFADAFGCSGDNREIRLSWNGAPKGTRSYAVTMFDKDAPTGAGFWHWLTWDIPATHSSLDGALPSGAIAGTHDAGGVGYLGPCPPSGDRAHHYQITVYALDVPSLRLPASTTPTATAFTMSGHIIGFARLTATARR
ncbi:YbhB/YbcL family Raf kinase inhibitor-like protein [Streptomyces sp. RPA4-5]|uniref:YbhB/YbcL family Raf kinase inhibitor-like protein n=1 Tax=Streptomyces sp. RPA4-5 TaxID=2721245 RepID=UPI00143E216B|nr:YbhB/YbcL family Raf kinase inhibitor-like protein [Streptomyces sp. RPA4-5]